MVIWNIVIAFLATAFVTWFANVMLTKTALKAKRDVAAATQMRPGGLSKDTVTLIGMQTLYVFVALVGVTFASQFSPNVSVALAVSGLVGMVFFVSKR
ncbi:MAG: hypothetical protein ACRCXZ_08725 [Patescibacteria group bacterium]